MKYENNLDSEFYVDTISNSQKFGNEMHELMAKLFPICRSITGDGVRKSLSILKNHIDLEIIEVKSGTQVFDWTIPKEWNITDAYIKNSKGEKIVDFQKSNLHVLNYSIPINNKMNLDKLKSHLFTNPNQPDLIPYLTTYYNEKWGFCLSHNQFLKLKEDEYEVFIDSTLEIGSLTYGEYFKKGKLDDEIVITCYICHPSMCNDNLSGTVIATFLAKILSNIETRYSYRFLFIPETIGAITWLSKNESKLKNIKHGLVITCAGDSGNLTYKKSRKGDHEIDKAVQNVLKNSSSDYNIEDFFPSGSDERQFCSPAFDLPFGSLMRTRYGKFSEYHTSADNLNFVKAEFLADTFSKYIEVFLVLENNLKFKNLNPKCEPQLGKRGLYRLIGGQKDNDAGIDELALFWVLNQSDGKNSLLDISNKSNLSFIKIKNSADVLLKANLLEMIN